MRMARGQFTPSNILDETPITLKTLPNPSLKAKHRSDLRKTQDLNDGQAAEQTGQML